VKLRENLQLLKTHTSPLRASNASNASNASWHTNGSRHSRSGGDRQAFLAHLSQRQK